MNDDLFSFDDKFRTIDLPDSEISFLASLRLYKPNEVVLQELISTVPWRSEEIVVWGKKHPQPRLTAWYGDDTSSYSYSGITLRPLKWTDALLSIRESVETRVSCKFNSVLLNFYRDERDSIGFHSDDEIELGARPVIASLSLGDERTFILKHKTRKELKPARLRLPSGSLLVMRGDTQRYWKHGIEKETRHCGPRVNLTFRTIHSST